MDAQMILYHPVPSRKIAEIKNKTTFKDSMGEV